MDSQRAIDAILLQQSKMGTAEQSAMGRISTGGVHLVRMCLFVLPDPPLPPKVLPLAGRLLCDGATLVVRQERHRHSKVCARPRRAVEVPARPDAGHAADSA